MTSASTEAQPPPRRPPFTSSTTRSSWPRTRILLKNRSGWLDLEFAHRVLAPCSSNAARAWAAPRRCANVLTYCGIYTNEQPPQQMAYGVAEEVLAALRAEGAVSGTAAFHRPGGGIRSRSAQAGPRQACAAAGVQVQLHSQIIAAHRDAGRITSLQVADHRGVTSNGGPPNRPRSDTDFGLTGVRSPGRNLRPHRRVCPPSAYIGALAG